MPKRRYAYGVNYSYKKWIPSPYWLATGALFGACCAWSADPGGASPKALLPAWSGLLLGFGVSEARGPVFWGNWRKKTAFIGALFAAVVCFWLGPELLSTVNTRSQSEQIWFLLAWGMVGFLWFSLRPDGPARPKWNTLQAIAGAGIAVLYPIVAMALSALAGLIYLTLQQRPQTPPPKTQSTRVGAHLIFSIFFNIANFC